MLLPKLIIAATLANLASAWSIAFYSSTNCNQDPSFNDATYEGTGKGDCLVAGNPGDDCIWHTNNGASPADCTAPMNPSPGSFMFPTGTNCRIGTDKSCWSNEGLYSDQALECFKTEDLYTAPGASGELYFACYDV